MEERDRERERVKEERQVSEDSCFLYACFPFLGCFVSTVFGLLLVYFSSRADISLQLCMLLSNKTLL